jgi:hypothetical protein
MARREGIYMPGFLLCAVFTALVRQPSLVGGPAKKALVLCLGLLYVIRKLANLGSWPPIFCSFMYCTKYQKNCISRKLEIRPLE